MKVPLKLAPGTEVHFRTYSELDGTASMVARGHEANDGMSASTDPNEAIDDLTWLLVSK